MHVRQQTPKAAYNIKLGMHVCGMRRAGSARTHANAYESLMTQMRSMHVCEAWWIHTHANACERMRASYSEGMSIFVYRVINVFAQSSSNCASKGQERLQALATRKSFGLESKRDEDSRK